MHSNVLFVSLLLALTCTFPTNANADQLFKVVDGTWVPVNDKFSERLEAGTYYIDVNDEGVNAYVLTAATMTAVPMAVP